MTMKDNLATTFLLPLLGMSPKIISASTPKGQRRIINCYLYDDSLEAYKKDHLLVLHSNYQDAKFNEWENLLIGQEHCIDSYDILDTNFSVKVFNMTPYEDYYTFLEGKYSQFSDWGQGRVINAPINSTASNVAQSIITKSEALKKALADKYNITDLSVFEECAPIWDQANVPNILDNSVREFLSTKIKPKMTPNKLTI
jgi:hypothetical protein